MSFTLATKRLTLRTGAMAREVTVDERGRASGVSYIDTATIENYRVSVASSDIRNALIIGVKRERIRPDRIRLDRDHTRPVAVSQAVPEGGQRVLGRGECWQAQAEQQSGRGVPAAMCTAPAAMCTVPSIHGNRPSSSTTGVN